MNLSDVALAAQTAQKESLTLAEKGITSAKVVLTGFVVVFEICAHAVIRIEKRKNWKRQKITKHLPRTDALFDCLAIIRLYFQK